MKLTIALQIFLGFCAPIQSLETCCANPKHSWRLKLAIDLDWNTAKTAFYSVFSTPYNTNFPTKIVTGIQDFIPLSDHSYTIVFSNDGGKNNVTESVNNYQSTNTCATGSAHMDFPAIGIQLDVDWFHAINENPNGIVSYYFGPMTPTGIPLPTGKRNFVCNEKNIGQLIFTSVKRRACVVQNYDDPKSQCT